MDPDKPLPDPSRTPPSDPAEDAAHSASTQPEPLLTEREAVTQDEPQAQSAASPAQVAAGQAPRARPWLLGLLSLLVLGTLVLAERRLSRIEQRLSSLQETVGTLPPATVDAIIAWQNGEAPGGGEPQADPSTNLDDDAIMGDLSTAQLALVEFSDFNCPYCARFHAETLGAIKEKYIDTGQLVYVHRDYVGVGGPTTHATAAAAECLRDQAGDDTYYDLVEYLYSAQGVKNEALVRTFAEEQAFDTAALDDCVAEQAFREEVAADTTSAQSKGVRGTPAFVLGTLAEDGSVTGVTIAGAQPFENFDRLIQEQLSAN